jgi:hypothetical protein
MIKTEPRVKHRKARTGLARSANAKASLKQNNGLVGTILEIDDVDAARPTARVKSKRAARSLAGATAARPTPLTKLDPEAAARQCLERALEGAETKSRGLRAGVRPPAPAATDLGKAEFRSLGAEAVPLTGTTMVKFRQAFNKIPVYGSLVTVEIDRKNRCLGINSSLGTPKGVRHIAKIAPEKSSPSSQGLGPATLAAHERAAALLLTRTIRRGGSYRRKRASAQAQGSRRRSQRRRAQGLRRRRAFRQLAGRPAAHVDHGIDDRQSQGWTPCQPPHHRREKSRRTTRAP